MQERSGRIAGSVHRTIASRGRTVPATVTDVSPRLSQGYVWASIGSSTVKILARTLDSLLPGDTIFVRKMTRDRMSYWAYDGVGTPAATYPAVPFPINPIVAPLLYFCPGYNYPSTGNQVWSYDGTHLSLVWDNSTIDGDTRGNIAITLLVYSLTSKKLLICMVNSDNYIGNPDYPDSIWQEGANEIYEYDPSVGGTPVKVAEFNYTDADFGFYVQFGCAAEIGNKIYFGMADFTYDAHLVRFDPVTHAVELVDSLFQPNNYSFDDEWSGIVGEAGGTLYWMRDKTLRMSSSGNLGTWSDGPNLGTFDPNNYYSYPDAGWQASDRLYIGTAASDQTSPFNRGIAVMSIYGGTFHQEFRTGYPDHNDDEFYGPFIAPLWNADGSLNGTYTIPRGDINTAFEPANVWTNAGGGWGWDGEMPSTPREYPTYYDDEVAQTKPLCSFQGKLYSLIKYNDAAGFGTRLLRRDGPGTSNWTVIQNFSRYDSGNSSNIAMTVGGTTIPVQSR